MGIRPAVFYLSAATLQVLPKCFGRDFDVLVQKAVELVNSFGVR